MKKISDNIEQQYKSQFDDYQHDFDQAAMWHSLDATLPQKSQPKIAAFALASALMISILAGALWINQDTAQATSANNPIVEKTNPIDNVLENKSLLAITAMDVPQDESATSLQTAYAKNPTNPVLQPKGKTAISIQNTSSSNAIRQSVLQPKATVSSPSIKTLQTPTQKSTENAIATWDKIPLNPTSMTAQTIEKQQLQNRISLLPTLSANISMTNPNLLQKEALLRDGDLDCPLFGGKKRTQMKGHGFIDLYGEGDVNMTTIKSQNSETNAYQNAWNDTDTPLGSYELGVLLGYEFDNGLYAGLGLEYQKTVEKLEYQQTVIQRITVWSEEAYFYFDGAGNQVFVADSVTTQSIYERSVKSGKEHTILNLPIMLGYNIHANNWNIGLFGGVNINLSHKFEGKIINSSNAFVTLDADNYETVYKNKLGASAFAGIHLGRNLGNSIELYFNPTVRIYPKSWMQDDYALSAKYKLAGLRVGLRYKL